MWWRSLGKGEIGGLSEGLAFKLESRWKEESSSQKMGLGAGGCPRKNKVPKTERSLWILGTDKISVCLELHGYYKIWLMPSDRWQVWRRQTYKQIVTYIMINTEQRKVQSAMKEESVLEASRCDRWAKLLKLLGRVAKLVTTEWEILLEGRIFVRSRDGITKAI